MTKRVISCWKARQIVALAGTLCWVGLAYSDVQTISLPHDYADFAIHPETGSLAALKTETNEVVFFRDKDLAAKEVLPATRSRTGANPCSIFYKRYGNSHFFAVVCSQDSHMYVFNAGGANPKDDDFALLKKIELSQSGITFVTGSINPADPFLYYCQGDGHESEAGVVSLRDLRSHGVAFGDSMDCAISASGEVAYRRGPWSPSGFESLIRTNSLTADKPEFSRLFYDHTSTAGYFPDPFDKFTAAGPRIYNRSLEKNVAELDFVPQCFFTTKPIIVGTSGDDALSRGRSRASDGQKVTLRAASYNTFTNIGDQVPIPSHSSNGAKSLPRETASSGDRRQVNQRSRVFADESRSRVVYARGNRLHVVPLADFNLPDEPFLLAKLKGHENVLVQQDNSITLELLDYRVDVTYDEIPDGMKTEGEKISWKPAADQVGPATIVATLKHKEIQRTMRFNIDVKFPSTELPFVAADFVVDQEAKHAVVWDGPIMDEYGRPQADVSSSIVNLALIELATGKVKAERKVSEQIGHAVVTRKHIILRPLSGSPKCEILRISDLERQKSLVADGPILQIDAPENLLVIQTQRGIEVYDSISFKKLKFFADSGNSGGSALSEYGLFVGGVLYGVDLKPKLIIDPGELPRIGGMHQHSQPSSFLQTRWNQNRQQAGRNFGFFGSRGQSRVGSVEIPGSANTVSLDVSRQPLQVPGSVHTWRTEFSLALTASGHVDDRQVILREKLHSQTASEVRTPPPILRSAKDSAFVAYGTHLYRWSVPIADADKPQATIQLKPQQSAISIKPNAATQLTHTLLGGKPPVSFSVLNPSQGVSIDESTGTVTVDYVTIKAEAIKAVEDNVRQFSRSESYVQTFSARARALTELANRTFGIQSKGVPVAVAIHVSASDSDLASADLRYFVIAEIPINDFLTRMQELDKQREQQRQEMLAARARARQGEGAGAAASASDIIAVQKKLDNLEQRLDMLTRQLNLVLKKLDEQDEKK